MTRPVDLSKLSPQEKRQLLASLLQERAGLEPLSYGQRGMWFLYQLAPESAAYNTGFAARIFSDVKTDVLENAFKSVIKRHDSLRSTFELRNGEPVRRIHANFEFGLNRVLADAWDEAKLQQEVQRECARPFNLESGPVIRATLYSRSSRDHVLLLVIHHIAFDGWSFWVLFDELRALYEAGSQNTQLQLPALPAQYKDFVDRERATASSPEGEAHWAFWQRQLEGELPLLELPTDHPRPPQPVFQGDTITFKLDNETADSLRNLAAAEKTTVFTVLLAAFQAFLFRYTGQEDILVGSPTTGRSRPEFSGIVGDFINMVVLRGHPAGDLRFRDFLRKMRVVSREALEHQDFPFALLLERLGIARAGGHSPVFQSTFVFHRAQRSGGLAGIIGSDNQAERIEWAGLQLAPYSLRQQEGQYELTLEVADQGDQLVAALKYNSALIERATAERMASHLRELISDVAADSDRQLGDLPLLTARERTQILEEWNATTRQYPETTLSALIEDQVRRTPTATALRFNGQSMTYEELNKRANRLARHLRTMGVGPEVLVAICVQRSFEMVVALLATLKAGGAYVPVDPGYPLPRQAFIVQDSHAPVLLTEKSLSNNLPATSASVFLMDEDWHKVEGQSAEDLGKIAEPDNLSYVIYTSGSTGTPKGAMNAHRGVCNRLLWMQEEYRLTQSDRVLQKTPFSFDVSVWEFFWPLMTGAQLVIAAPEEHKDPKRLARVIQEEAITTLHFVPSMLRVFLEAGGAAFCDSVKRVVCSGEALAYELQQEFFRLTHADLHNLYGPTEAAVDVTFWPCERESSRDIVPIGRPVANTQMYVLDSRMEPVPAGVTGELYIGGVQVGRGYWGRPELTAERYIPNPFRPGERLYRTGDLARWTPEGVIEYLGRNDHQVKIRGLRIELGEIENVLRRQPNVKDALVELRTGAGTEGQLTAYIVWKGDREPSVGDLRNSLKQHLPEYMVPANFLMLDTFPLLPNGKLDRKALGKLCSTVQSDRYVAPRTPLEEELAKSWAELLNVKRVGAIDNFFELGGHSLLAARALTRIQERYKIELPLRAFFESPTVGEIAEQLEAIQRIRQHVDEKSVELEGEREEFLL
ncbi:MAG TPA: amino acid adenylation domain-containing protein [Terriglobales bacterium]